MKKTIILSIAALTVLTVSAQLPVSQTPGKKTALLEEYTGKKCVYCPDGHKKADEVIKKYAGKAVAVNIHAGSFAIHVPPPNYKSEDGDILYPTMNIKSFPSGILNRGEPTTRSLWDDAIKTIVEEDSYVNIAGEATLDSASGVLTVKIEAYYTANAPVSSNNLTVMLMQDNILGPQEGGSTYYPAMMVGSQYRHMHMLRDIITTGATGEPMGATASGTKFTKTINYTVPKIYHDVPVVFKDIHLIAFITETKKGITACKVPLSYGTVSSVNDLNTFVNNINVYPNPSNGVFNTSFYASNSDNYNIKIFNALGQVVYEEPLKNFSGSYSKEINISSFGQGVYMLSISSSMGEEVKRLITY
jgi:hypothetical protein